MSNMNGIITVLLIVGCVLRGVCRAAPVEEPKEADESSIAEEELWEGYRSKCIPTPWGCINLNDPSYRPRAQSNQEEIRDILDSQILEAKNQSKKKLDRIKSEYENVEIQFKNVKIEIKVELCIPTAWGCIDISDPSFRPFGAMEIDDNGRESKGELKEDPPT
ncbi:uncharacterized protein [Euwallacea similis]|uniref:uncharacterized protein n=1 Tax=Euwallacea similis TaxID=1736056 RepID=UPI00344CA936